MKNIIIIGERYSTNLGDGVICRCVEELIRQYAEPNDNIICLDLSCRKNYNEAYCFKGTYIQRMSRRICNRIVFSKCIKKRMIRKLGNKLYMYWTWYYLNQAIIDSLCKSYKADIVVFAGGELFKDYFLFYIRKYVRLFSKQNAKIWFNACGIDEKNTTFVIQQFKHILNKEGVRRVTTRSSLRTCEKLIDMSSYIFRPDPVVCCADFFERSKKENGIGLGIMCLDGINDKKEQLINFWSDIITILVSQGREFKLFCNGAPEDYKFATEVLEYVGLSQDNLLPCPQTPEELIAEITSFDRICSFRMHSLIIAYAFGIPFVGLGWDRKLFDFADCIHAKEQICDWEVENPEEVLSRMDTCCIEEERFQGLKSLVYDEFAVWLQKSQE